MIALAFSLLLSFSASATEENRGWLGIFSRKESSAHSHFTHQELQIRYNFENGSNQQLLARFGLLKPISETQEIGFLMGYIETGDLIEYRPTLQHLIKSQASSRIWSLRSRLEWREWQDTNTNSLRSRFQISLLQKLNSSYSLLVWDEPFLNLTHDSMSGERFFERNRAFIGVRFPFMGHNVELGYLNQHVPRQTDLTEHIAVAYLYF